MMKWKRSVSGNRTGIDLAEEALFVLRHSTLSVLLSYFVGTIPFVLGLLYFWTDMSRSPFAASYVGQAAIGMSALYVWMKSWHSIFATLLLANISGDRFQKFSILRIVKLITAQLAIQPYGWFVIPVSALAILPLPWSLAFFQSFSLTGNGSHTNLRSALKQAGSLANLWQGQNFRMVFLLIFFSLSVFLGIAIFIIFIPYLLDALLGIETVFTKAGFAIFNSTYFAISAGLTFLCVNPLLKTAYVLRAFYGQSITSGADLKAELRASEIPDERRSESRRGNLIIACFIFISIYGQSVGAGPRPARVAPVTVPGGSETRPYLQAGNNQEAQQTVTTDQLDQSIEKVIHEREYQWRIPREAQDTKSDNNFLEDFLLGIRDTLASWMKPVERVFKKIIDWIFDKLFPRSVPGSAGKKTPISNQTTLITVLIAVVVLILAVLLYRTWKKREKEEIVIADVAAVAIPDLEDESTTADQYPEEGWLALAREHMERGELRLALRALYLSTLVFLSRREILTITKYKSNREYHRELQRKAQSNKNLLEAFQENLFLFERSWYGEHEVSGEVINRFNYNQERIREIA